MPTVLSFFFFAIATVMLISAIWFPHTLKWGRSSVSANTLFGRAFAIFWSLIIIGGCIAYWLGYINLPAPK